MIFYLYVVLNFINYGNNMRTFILTLLFITVTCAQPVFADTVLLTDGRTLRTSVTWEKDGKLYYSKYGGDIGIPLDQVKDVLPAKRPGSKPPTGTAGKLPNSSPSAKIKGSIDPMVVERLTQAGSSTVILADIERNITASDLDRIYLELVRKQNTGFPRSGKKHAQTVDVFLEKARAYHKRSQ